ncbi:MAG: hypothetical protein CVV12_12020 [Gammaproteobacteria bacterium HGW-Gammaproteobacteria-2]|nr:MAG: hypothetical protein CVV12_12020 [Gammaproteobacteria bacterium HGW-Gammaproteobacteria-2]
MSWGGFTAMSIMILRASLGDRIGIQKQKTVSFSGLKLNLWLLRLMNQRHILIDSNTNLLKMSCLRFFFGIGK